MSQLRSSACVLAFLCACLFGVANSVRGLAITYTGEAFDSGVNSAVHFGTDGYDLYATSTEGTAPGFGTTVYGPTRVTSLPSYITSIVANGATVSYHAGQTGVSSYAPIINPATNAQIHSGYSYDYTTSNAEKGLFDITIGAGAPSTFYIGMLTGPNNGDINTPNQVRMAQTAGVGAGNTGLANVTADLDGVLDTLGFQVTGAHAGDVIHVSGVELAPDSAGFYDLGTPGFLFTQNPIPDVSAVPLPPAAYGALSALLIAGLVARKSMRATA